MKKKTFYRVVKKIPSQAVNLLEELGARSKYEFTSIPKTMWKGYREKKYRQFPAHAHPVKDYSEAGQVYLFDVLFGNGKRGKRRR